MLTVDEKKKQVIGLYGEMRLSMELHELGWQVHRAYLDEGIDFVATKYYCSKCNKYSEQYIREQYYKGIKKKCVTNLCKICKESKLEVVSRYLQVKTSEGIVSSNKDAREFSFHPKIRYDMGKEMFYVWIALFENKQDKYCYFYIFNTAEVSKFDDITIDTYQITDNQKTSLRIRSSDGVILNKGSKYDYSCFHNLFLNNWNALELELI